MIIYLELLIVFYILFLIFFCAYEAFDRLSGGMIHKIEENDEKFAEKLSIWQQKNDPIRAVFKLLLFLLITFMGVFSYVVVKEFLAKNIQGSGFTIMAIAVLVAWAIGETFSRLALFRFDIFLLRFAVPVVSFLAQTIFWPVLLFMKVLRDNAMDQRDEEEKVGAEDEILSFVDKNSENKDDDLEEGEKRMIRGILDLDDMTAHEIMTPRVEVKALPATASIEEAKKCFIESGHSRIPVYGRSVDEIKGIIYAKDFIDQKRIEGKTLDQLSHIPVFVPESKEVGELLEEFKRLHNHFAVVIDEYGGTSGIITFEDIIEEIIGDVQDEYDSDKEEKQKPQLMPDGSVVMEARTPIASVNDIMESDLPESEDADTIGGIICNKLGRIPDPGECFHFENSELSVEILKADERRIHILKLFIDTDGSAGELLA